MIHPLAAIILGILFIILGLTALAWLTAAAINYQGRTALDDELFYRTIATWEQETDHV